MSISTIKNVLVSLEGKRVVEASRYLTCQWLRQQQTQQKISLSVGQQRILDEVSAPPVANTYGLYLDPTFMAAYAWLDQGGVGFNPSLRLRHWFSHRIPPTGFDTLLRLVGADVLHEVIHVAQGRGLFGPNHSLDSEWLPSLWTYVSEFRVGRRLNRMYGICEDPNECLIYRGVNQGVHGWISQGNLPANQFSEEEFYTMMEQQNELESLGFQI